MQRTNQFQSFPIKEINLNLKEFNILTDYYLFIIIISSKQKKNFKTEDDLVLAHFLKLSISKTFAFLAAAIYSKKTISLNSN